MEKFLQEAQGRSELEMHSAAFSLTEEKKGGLFFGLVCTWVYVLIGRPQDLFSPLFYLRPALLMSIFILIGIAFGNNIFDRRLKAVNSQAKIFLVLFLIMIAGIPFSLHRRYSFNFVFTYYVQVVLFFFVMIHVLDSRRKIEKILFICCFGVGLYSIVAIRHADFSIGRVAYGRVFDPNDIAYFVISFIMFNLYFLGKGNSSWVKAVSTMNIIAGILLVLLTGSRAGIVGFSAIILMLLFARHSLIRPTYKMLLLVSLVAVLFNPHINFDRYRTIFDLENDYNVTAETGRVAIWKSGWQIMLSNPVTGVGVTSFRKALGSYRTKRGLLPKWQNAHNSLLQVGAETGVFGLLIFGLLSVRAFRIFGRVSNCSSDEKLCRIGMLAKIGFAGHFICAMFLSQAYSVHWAFYIALSAILSRMLQKEVEVKEGHSDVAFAQ